MMRSNGATRWWRELALIALLLFLGLFLAGCGSDDESQEQPVTPDSEDQTSGISSFFESVGESVAQTVAGDVVGWGLSAIGIGGSSDTAELEKDLEQIVNLLEGIESSLEQINTTLQNLVCENAQNSTALQNAVNQLESLYQTYQQWVNNAQAYGTIPSESDVNTWIDEVLADEGGALQALDAIQNALMLPGGSGVIDECVQYITTTYNNGDLPEKNILTDGVYYSQIGAFTGYYYAYQAYGAAILSEAYHLKACFAAGTCAGFEGSTIPGDSNGDVTPDNPGVICENPTDPDVAAACADAVNAVNLVYGNLVTQLTEAGAPYTTSEVAIVWGRTLLWVRSLEDFTNNATVNDQEPSQCSTPLGSDKPCGQTVGEYNLEINPRITYGGYPYNDEQSNLWKWADGSQMDALLVEYNKTSSGTLGDWMNSIGFTTAQNKLVITPQTGNGPLEETTLCFMDTSVDRSHSAQPWCDGDGQSTLNLDDVFYGEPCEGETTPGLAQASWVPTNRADFYTISVCMEQDAYEWSQYPGYFTDQQGNTAFHQYHWPVLNVDELDCTARAAGNRNPGGIPTLCGHDLTVWLEGVVPPPEPLTRQ